MSLFRFLAGTLNGLRGAIGDQGFGFLSADFGLPLDTDQWSGELFDPLDRAASRASVDVVKKPRNSWVM